MKKLFSSKSKELRILSAVLRKKKRQSLNSKLKQKKFNLVRKVKKKIAWVIL